MNRVKKLFMLWKHRHAVRHFLSFQLSLLEKDELVDALGGLTEKEISAVCACAKKVPENSVIIELGTLFGLTAQALGEAAPKGVKILAVDNFTWNPFGLPPRLHRQFTERILRPYLDAGRIEIIAQDSATFRQTYGGATPSMIFIDAEHTYGAVIKEGGWAKKIGIPFISGHDYKNPGFMGVTRAVDELFPEGVETSGMVWWREQ